MVNEFCGFKHGVIGTDKMPADTTLNNMKKADLIKLLHTAQHNYETLMWFYNNAVKANMSQLNNNGWIPCSERLPKDDEYVLCSLNENNPMIIHTIIIAQYNGENHWCNGTVVAWQQLPPAYVPEEGRE